jgi:hypothetical protein
MSCSNNEVTSRGVLELPQICTSRPAAARVKMVQSAAVIHGSSLLMVCDGLQVHNMLVGGVSRNVYINAPFPHHLCAGRGRVN